MAREREAGVQVNAADLYLPGQHRGECPCSFCDNVRRARILARAEKHFRFRRWMHVLKRPIAALDAVPVVEAWDDVSESGVRPTVRPPRMARNATQQA